MQGTFATIFHAGLFVAAACLGVAARPATGDEELAARIRRPVAVVISEDGKRLYTANRRSGSVSIVDLERRKTTREVDLGERLSDMVAVPDGRLLATDETAHQLLVLSADGTRWVVDERLPVAPYPVSVVASGDGRRCFVASLWSRRLTIVDLGRNTGGEPRITATLDLPFAPRKQLLVCGDTKLIVANSFGGQLGIVDTDTGKLDTVRKFPAHNIRAMALSVDGRKLLVAHQILNELAQTVSPDVHWGSLMSNDLRWLMLDAVLDPKADLFADAHMHPLGSASSAAGDPSGMAMGPGGTVVVTLGGVGQIAMGQEGDFGLFRLQVGRRPTAVAVSADGQRAYVANTFGDSVSIVNLATRQSIAEVSLGPQAPLSLLDRGEMVFYDAGLSMDGWMSCHSCHTDGHTNGLLNDNLSDGTFGSPKRVLSLLGVADTAPYAWNGSNTDLGVQIRNSARKTMLGSVPRESQVKALAGYLRNLKTPPPLAKLRGTQDDAAADRGQRLFRRQGCRRCHAPPTYTTPKTYNVGLTDQTGQRRFNPPSLRGVSQREPYFHDNRAKSLEEVFRKHRHQLRRDLSAQELIDLITFLRTL